MADQQSEKSPHKSRFGGGWLAHAQYLAESMCDRIARKDKTELPLKFWEQERWKRHFLMQVRHANSLLKVYEIDAIMRALRTPKGKTIYSLGAQFILDPLVRVEQEKLVAQRAAVAANPTASPEPKTTPSVAEAPRPTFVEKPNLLSKLRDL